MRISFKRQKKPTGLAAVANPNPTTNIIMDGKKIGFMDALGKEKRPASNGAGAENQTGGDTIRAGPA